MGRLHASVPIRPAVNLKAFDKQVEHDLLQALLVRTDRSAGSVAAELGR
jgi:hypothetical protein